MAAFRRVVWLGGWVCGWACALAGCTSIGGSSTAEAGEAGIHVQRAESALLTVIRDDSAAGIACPLELLVDAQPAGSLEPKGWVTVYPAPGAHLVAVRALGAACAASCNLRAQMEADKHLRLRLVREAPSGTLRLVPAPA